jgi:hypothetical protein
VIVLFARMLGVRQESAMHHPAVAIRQGPGLDRRTAHQQTHSQQKAEVTTVPEAVWAAVSVT